MPVSPADILLQTVMPVFAIIGLGLVYARLRQTNLETITEYIIYFSAPCLAFTALLEKPILTEELLIIATGGVFTVLFCGALIFIYNKVTGTKNPGIYLSAMFMNAGNMGLPLILFQYGQEGLARAVIWYITVAIIHFSFGVSIAKGKGGFKEMFKLPLVYAAALALFLSLNKIEVPSALLKVTSTVGYSTIPLMLFALGCRLATVKFSNVKLALVSTLARQGGGLVAILLFSYLIGARGLTFKVMVVDAVMPSAVFNFILSERYKKQPEEVSSAIMLSTVLAIVLVPAIIYLLG